MHGFSRVTCHLYGVVFVHSKVFRIQIFSPGRPQQIFLPYPSQYIQYMEHMPPRRSFGLRFAFFPGAINDQINRNCRDKKQQEC